LQVLSPATFDALYEPAEPAMDGPDALAGLQAVDDAGGSVQPVQDGPDSHPSLTREDDIPLFAAPAPLNAEPASRLPAETADTEPVDLPPPSRSARSSLAVRLPYRR
jgi:hypothetical protein